MEQVTAPCFGVCVAVAEFKSQAAVRCGTGDAELNGQRLINQRVTGVQGFREGEIESGQIACCAPHQAGGEDGMPHWCSPVRFPVNVIGDGDRAGVVEKKGVVKAGVVHAGWCEHQLLHQAGEGLLADGLQGGLQHRVTAVAVVEACPRDSLNGERLVVGRWHSAQHLLQGRQCFLGPAAAVGVGIAQTAGVVQQHAEAHRHLFGEVVFWDRPTRQVTVDGFIQSNFLGGKEFHRGQGGEGLGDRLGLKQGVGRDRSAAGQVRQAKAPRPGDASVFDHRDRGTWNVVLSS